MYINLRRFFVLCDSRIRYTPRMISLEDQLAIFDDRAVAALDATRSYVAERIGSGDPLHRTGIHIIRLARTRLREGFEVYGDEMFRQSSEELGRESDEELADILNRMVALVSLRG